MEWNKPRARRNVDAPDHSYCWRQAEIRAAQQYEREGERREADQFSAYGRSALGGDLRRMDAERLREELYENCLTLRAQAREADRAAAVKESPAATAIDEADAQETGADSQTYQGEESEEFEDIIVPPPLE